MAGRLILDSFLVGGSVVIFADLFSKQKYFMLENHYKSDDCFLW